MISQIEIEVKGAGCIFKKTMFGKKYGVLAIHKTNLGFGEGDTWTVTHVPTGWAVKRFIEDRKTALALINKIKHLPWEKVTPKNAKRLVKKDVQKAFKELGIS